jgi:ubiquinone/menaquinone biosynthesis C-methylase UbiE
MKNEIYKSDEYSKMHPDWHIVDSPWKADKVTKIVNQNNIEFDSVCEIGCGVGEILVQLQTNSFKDKSFYGYEISPFAYNEAIKRENDKLKFYLKDIAEIKDNSYDLVLIMDVIEHVEDLYGFLAKIKTKGKYKVFHIPLDLSIMNLLFKKIVQRRKLSGHIHYFTRETALETLKDSGFEIHNWVYTNGSIEIPAKSMKQKLKKFVNLILSIIAPEFATIVFGNSVMVLAE